MAYVAIDVDRLLGSTGRGTGSAVGESDRGELGQCVGLEHPTAGPPGGGESVTSMGACLFVFAGFPFGSGQANVCVDCAVLVSDRLSDVELPPVISDGVSAAVSVTVDGGQCSEGHRLVQVFTGLVGERDCMLGILYCLAMVAEVAVDRGEAAKGVCFARAVPYLAMQGEAFRE